MRHSEKNKKKEMKKILYTMIICRFKHNKDNNNNNDNIRHITDV